MEGIVLNLTEKILDIAKVVISNVMIGVRWGMIFFSFWLSLYWILKKLVPNLIEDFDKKKAGN